MAVTKIHPIKTTLNKAIDYICNPDKTDNQILISSYGCSYQTADIEFGFTLSKARDKGDNLGHHLIQSFAPGEVSYEAAHRIGKELAEKKDKLYQEYGKLKKKVKQYDTIKQNVDSILRQAKQQEREKQTER